MVTILHPLNKSATNTGRIRKSILCHALAKPR